MRKNFHIRWQTFDLYNLLKFFKIQASIGFERIITQREIALRKIKSWLKNKTSEELEKKVPTTSNWFFYNVGLSGFSSKM